MKLITAILSLILLLVACQKNPTANYWSKSPTEYTWTSDTLEISGVDQILMSAIWGNSPNSIFVTGISSSPRATVFHFDGNNWSEIASQGGAVTDSVSLRAVFGFSGNDVWFGGENLYVETTQISEVEKDSAIILHYNGVGWERIPIYGRGEGGLNIANIWGSNPSDIWFAGYSADIYRWNGSSIERVHLPDEISSTRSYANWVTGNSGKEVYFSLATYELNYRRNQLWRFANSTWEKLTEPDIKLLQIWMSPDNTLFKRGGAGSFLEYFDGSNWVYAGLPASSGVTGPGDNFLMAFDWRGRVYSYKYKDRQEIEALRLDGIEYKAIWYDGFEAFLLAWQDGKSIVFHGK